MVNGVVTMEPINITPTNNHDTISALVPSCFLLTNLSSCLLFLFFSVYVVVPVMRTSTVYACGARRYMALSDHPSSMPRGRVCVGDEHVTGIPLMNALFCNLSIGVPRIEVIAYTLHDDDDTNDVSHMLILHQGAGLYGVIDTLDIVDVDGGGGSFWYDLYYIQPIPRCVTDAGTTLGGAIAVFMDRVAYGCGGPLTGKPTTESKRL